MLVSFVRVEGVNEGVNEGANEGVSEGVDRLYQVIKENPGLRVPELSTRIHVPLKTLERWVRQLRSKQRIVFKGAAKTGGYYIADDER